MKKLLAAIFLVLFCLSVNAQIKISALPRYTGSLGNTHFVPLADSGSNNTYKYKLKDLIFDSTSISNRINQKLSLGDTSNMLQNYFKNGGNTFGNATIGTDGNLSFTVNGTSFGSFDGINNNVYLGNSVAAYTGLTNNNICIGNSTFFNASGNYNIFLGNNGSHNTASYVTALGHAAGDDNTYNHVVLLGFNAKASAANQFVFGSSYGNVRISNAHFNADRLHKFPDANGTYALSVKINGTTYDANDSGLINLGTINAGLTGSGTTNELAYFNGSSSIASLSTATYPSLTEFSYLKGVTAAVQTQLNAKQATLTNPITGTGTVNYFPRFSGTSALMNSAIRQDTGGVVIAPTSYATANGQTLYLADFAGSINSNGFSAITNGGYRFNSRILLNSYLEQNSTSSPNYFYGYNLLSGSTGTAHGSIVLGTNGANQQNGFAATFGGGSKLSAFVQYNQGISSSFVVNIGGTERFTMNGNAELLVNTTTSTGDKINCNGSVRATQFKLSGLNTAPSSSSDTGTTGEIRVVNSYIYVCVATNTWQRATLSTF